MSTFRLRKIKDDKEGEAKSPKQDAHAGAEVHDLGENLVKCIRDYDVSPQANTRAQ